MSPEIITLVETNAPLFFGLASGVFLGASIQTLVSQPGRRPWREGNRGRPRNEGRAGNVSTGPWPVGSDPRGPKQRDAADQLRIVMGAEFSIQPLLNRREVRVFRELDQIVIACNPDWQVMAQVSLGEILRCRDAEAYGCINSKRVDLLLVDENCRPRHAIEYQGAGHHQGTAAARDAIKKEALRRAGIGYHEVVAGHTTPSELRRLAERLVDKPTAA